jgi:hypothetical protein
MNLVCQNCGSELDAYFEQSGHNWIVWVGQDRDGKERLKAQPSDHPETRSFFNRLSPTRRAQEALQAGRTLSTKKSFDCSSCGEDDCVTLL